jgi:hypothetical protein
MFHYAPPRPLEEIEADIRTIDKDIMCEKWYRTPFRSQVLEFVAGCFQFLAMGGFGERTVKPYP